MIESTHILRVFYTKSGIMFVSKGQLNSRQGLLLTSISQGLKLRSIMKSIPKS